MLNTEHLPLLKEHHKMAKTCLRRRTHTYTHTHKLLSFSLQNNNNKNPPLISTHSREDLKIWPISELDKQCGTVRQEWPVRMSVFTAAPLRHQWVDSNHLPTLSLSKLFLPHAARAEHKWWAEKNQHSIQANFIYIYTVYIYIYTNLKKEKKNN